MITCAIFCGVEICICIVVARWAASAKQKAYKDWVHRIKVLTHQSEPKITGIP